MDLTQTALAKSGQTTAGAGFAGFADLLLRWEPVWVIPFGLLPLALPSLGLAAESWALGGLLVTLFPWLLRRWRWGYFTRRTPFDFPTILFLVGAVVGLIASLVPELSRARLWFIVGVVLMYYLGVNHASQRWLKIYLILFLSAGLVAIVFLLTQMGVSDDFPESGLEIMAQPILSWLGGFPKWGPPPGVTVWRVSGPGIAGGIIALLPYALVFAFWGSRSSRLISGLIILFLAMLLLVTSSRGAIVALILGMVSTGIIWKPRLLWTILLAPLVIYLTLTSPLVGKTESTLEIFSGQDTAYRLDLWWSAGQMISDFPLSGIGLHLENWYHLLPLYAPASLRLMGSNHGIPHSHNFFLQTYLEQGILGFLGAVSLFLISFPVAWRYLRRADGFRRLVILGSAGSLWALMFHGLVDSLPSSPALVLVWVPLALLVGAGRS